MVTSTLVSGDIVRGGGLVDWRRPRGETHSTQEPGRQTAGVAMESMKTR